MTQDIMIIAISVFTAISETVDALDYHATGQYQGLRGIPVHILNKSLRPIKTTPFKSFTHFLSMMWFLPSGAKEKRLQSRQHVLRYLKYFEY